MTVGKTLTACALAMAVGATAMMAAPDHAAAQFLTEFKPTKNPQRPEALETLEARSHSHSCSFTSRDGKPVKHNVDIFFDVATDVDSNPTIAGFRGFRLHTNTEAHAKVFVYQIRDGVNNRNKQVLVGPKIERIKFKKKDGRLPQQLNFNIVDQGFLSSPGILRGQTFEFFLVEDDKPDPGICGFTVAIASKQPKRVNNGK